MSGAISEKHRGKVPDEMDDLVKLPGVGRKTANVVLGNAFDKNEGVVVDTHVGRVSGRLGLTKNTDPVKVEQDLMQLFPRENWTLLSHLFIEHGRQICEARRPKCEVCFLNDICPSSLVKPPLPRSARPK
jgi:endonuclease-3